MSSRQMRKLLGDAALPPPADSDEEFEPLYAKSMTSRFQIDDEDEINDNVQPQSDKSESENGESEAPAPRKKKGKKKKKKNRAKDAENHNLVEPGTSSQGIEELDEIDRSVREVNQLLGEVEIRPSTSKGDVKVKPQETFMTINPKYLNTAFEMKKMLGAEAGGDNRGKRDGHPGIMFLQRRAVIVPMEEYVESFKKAGLSMSVLRREHGLTYFSFTHDASFSRAHRALRRVLRHRRALAHDYVAFLKTQVDQDRADPDLWLQFADELFMMEENTLARRFVEQAIAYLQYVAHPAFNFADSTVRLEFRYLENQPLFTACLRSLHLLTNRACHRSALELAKLMLQLDPTDPLAILLVVDALALRAREHRWLLSAEPHWAATRDADKLYNLQYSIPLAMWHLSTRDKEDYILSPATDRLREAILRFPRVFLQITSLAGLSLPPGVLSSKLFTHYADKTTKALIELGLLYARLTYNRWREPKVAPWMIATATQVARDLEWDGTLQNVAERYAMERAALYRAPPPELMRHMAVIRPMGSLLHDNLVHSISNVPEEMPPAVGEIDRYEYKKPEDKSALSTSALYEFLRSLVPEPPAGPR